MVGESGLKNNFVYCKNKIVTPLNSATAWGWTGARYAQVGKRPMAFGWSQDVALGDMVVLGEQRTR